MLPPDAIVLSSLYPQTLYSHGPAVNTLLLAITLCMQGWASELRYRANAAKSSLAKSQYYVHEIEHTITNSSECIIAIIANSWLAS